ncbi:MAG: hypothetical protein KME18_18215 [Phormidium tanganyikae FI6-MK23]|jgi:hypothetical protein|nr:hypothetical protein [Phormidium tanganyikae FI6-MK23]
MTNDEFESLINDTSKHINGDVVWVENLEHSPTVEFRVQIDSDEGYPLFIKGSFNRVISSLTYTLIHRSFGRIYGLDLGKDHRNPDGNLVGEKHKHRWDEVFRDKQAYRPDDITEDSANPVGVWKQFCEEANIIHNGKMDEPSNLQLEIF